MMWRIIRLLAAMVVGGSVTLFVTLLILMEMGLKYHGNYEYYGHQNPVLIWGIALIGCLAPGVLVWYLECKRACKIVGTLALMAVCGIVPLCVAGFVLMEFGERIHGNSMKAALWLGVYSFAVIGFLIPGVIAWYRHKRGARNGQSG